MYPRGSIYSTPNGKWRVESKCFLGIWKAKIQVIWDSMRKTQNIFFFMHISLCAQVFPQNLCVHAGIGLKVTYTHKHVFFGDFLGDQSITLERGFQGVYRGTWKAINLLSTKCGKISYNKAPKISSLQLQSPIEKMETSKQYNYI